MACSPACVSSKISYKHRCLPPGSVSHLGADCPLSSTTELVGRSPWQAQVVLVTKPWPFSDVGLNFPRSSCILLILVFHYLPSQKKWLRINSHFQKGALKDTAAEAVGGAEGVETVPVWTPVAVLSSIVPLGTMSA